jgi:hypothetical protein
MTEGTEPLSQVLRLAWARETSASPSEWSPSNPARGQCAVTALVVQDSLGGSILRGEVGRESHYWNLLSDGSQVDLTKDQFGAPVVVANIGSRTRDYILSFPETAKRYTLLRRRIRRLVSGS